MDYSSVKKIPFKGYARAYETTVKKLVTDPDTGKEVIKEEKIIQFGEFVEDKKKLPNYHEVLRVLAAPERHFRPQRWCRNC